MPRENAQLTTDTSRTGVKRVGAGDGGREGRGEGGEVSQSVSRSVSQSVIQSVSQSVSQLVSCVGQEGSRGHS